jgi:diaminopimelate decarboxylase
MSAPHSSPNQNVMPASASVNNADHLTIGGLDTVELAREFGTPLWVVDQETIVQAQNSCMLGLANYPGKHRLLYAGKAFLCLAMCKLVEQLGMGLDVVSEGELFTAQKAGFPLDLTYMHGNNKSQKEIETALKLGVKIVVDGDSELEMVSSVARLLNVTAPILLRVTPGVEPDTHQYIKTGQNDSKFGIPLDQVAAMCRRIKGDEHLELLGLHAHIGSQSRQLEPYLEIVEIMADCYQAIKSEHGMHLRQLDLGGGLGIAYTDDATPVGLFEWSSAIAKRVSDVFAAKNIELPELLLEPGRSIIGTAGITLYSVGHLKTIPDGTKYVAVDGGMADNPRPITYQARYTACLANRMSAKPQPDSRVTIVGRYCESGDIIIRDANLPAHTGDLIAIFGTGAYNSSMALNYNRTGRPACVLVSEARAEIILERESKEDLIRNDSIPSWLV